MKPVVIGDEATDEIREGIAFYEARQQGLGDRFQKAVESGLKRIGATPKAFTPYQTDYRKFVVKKFPYVIFYIEYDGYVWVAAIAHTSREPDYWAGRQPGNR